RLWADLEGADARRAYRAVWLLAESPASGVPFVCGQLLEGRAATPAHVARLIRLLGSDNFRERQKATADLERVGEAAQPALRKALAESRSGEARGRIKHLLERLKGPDDRRQELALRRALEVLEKAGGEEAKRTLRQLAGQGGWLAEEARAGLARLARP